MEYNIREVRPDDFDDLFVLVEQFVTSFEPDRAGFELCLRHLMPNEAAKLLVAEFNNQAIGYCLGFDHYTFYANNRVAWVEEITVKAEFRRQGIGRALMAEFEAWAESRGSKLVGLATRRAAPFYIALGYSESAIYFRKLLL